MEHLRVTAAKYNVNLKELLSLPHRTLKKKHCLNILSTVNISFFRQNSILMFFEM